MLQINLVRLFSVLALAFWTSALSASTITYEVGTCMPGLPSFPSITAALAVTPAANIVIVCPGTYREQVQITQPVTLKGAINDDSAQAIVAPPAGGLLVNAVNAFGEGVAAQLLVSGASGPVDISDLTIDGTGNGNPGDADFIAGIFYQDVSGTVNRVVTRNQIASSNGIGILAEGFTSPSVTVENSSVHNFDDVGIWMESVNPTLTAVIKGNDISSLNRNALLGLFIVGSAATVTNNLIINQIGRFPTPPTQGISVSLHSTGSISANTVVNGRQGIDTSADGVSVTSNNIFGSVTGIVLGTKIAAIHDNSITDSSVGIDFSCFADPNVQSNIIMEAGKALNDVPSALATSNRYFNVGKIRTGGC